MRQSIDNFCVGGSVWLKNWAETNSAAGGNPDVGKYLGIYLAFGIGSAALTVVQTLILWIFCSIEASRKLHERMATAIFRSPMSFFDTTPAGRIMNRFSKGGPPCRALILPFFSDLSFQILIRLITFSVTRFACSRARFLRSSVLPS